MPTPRRRESSERRRARFLNRLDAIAFWIAVLGGLGLIGGLIGLFARSME